MNTLLADFLNVFKETFDPPRPSRGDSGTNWLISRVWSDYTKKWLEDNYRVDKHDYYGKTSAAFWPNVKEGFAAQRTKDIAIKWMWDNNKVASRFPDKDFKTLFDVDARCLVALIQTRTDGRRGLTQADEIVKSLQDSHKQFNWNGRPVVLIEVRRVLQQKDRVDFICYTHDMSCLIKQEITRWSFSGLH